MVTKVNFSKIVFPYPFKGNLHSNMNVSSSHFVRLSFPVSSTTLQKIHRSFALVALFLLGGLSTSVAQSSRQSTELLQGWKFFQGESTPDATITDWKPVEIPHTYNDKYEFTGKRGDYYRGPGWYVKTLNAPSDWQGKRVFVKFEAVGTTAQVYLNGDLIGEHRGGFTTFTLELTNDLRYGEDNEIRVRADNSKQNDVAPLAGDFVNCGGIYRPVHLIVTEPLCITPLYFGSSGAFLTVKKLSSSEAQVEVVAWLSNGSQDVADCTVKVEIKDAGGTVVATGTAPATLQADMTTSVKQNIAIPNPRLWNGLQDPYLYTATISVQVGDLVDAITQNLGLRTVEVTKESGFLLNGKPYPIYGVNRHQDKQDKGWALTKEDDKEDVRLMLEMGTTAIRLGHYPQGAFFHEVCDKEGLLVWDELALVGDLKDTPEFRANAELQLREMILQLYNHPSVAFWGLFNELRTTIDTPRNAFYTSIIESLNGVAHELDQTRPTVAACNRRNEPYNKAVDLVCFNAYPGWYSGTPQKMAGYIKDWSSDYNTRVAISEYGAGANTQHHQEAPMTRPETKGQFHPEGWQAHVHEGVWAVIKDNPNLWGSFLWLMFDSATDMRNEGDQPGVNDKGLVTRDRSVKKDAFYFYKANWNADPMVYIADRRHTQRTKAQTEVKVYSNASEVELIVNGKSLGKVAPDRVRIARWPSVDLKAGENKIEAVANVDGKKLTDSCVWVLQTL